MYSMAIAGAVPRNANGVESSMKTVVPSGAHAAESSADSKSAMRRDPAAWIRPRGLSTARMRVIADSAIGQNERNGKATVRAFETMAQRSFENAVKAKEVFEGFRAAVQQGDCKEAAAIAKRAPRTLLAGVSPSDGQTMISLVRGSRELSSREQVRLIRLLGDLMHPDAAIAPKLIVPQQAQSRRVYKAGIAKATPAFESATILTTPNGSRLHYDPIRRSFPMPPTRRHEDQSSATQLNSIVERDESRVD